MKQNTLKRLIVAILLLVPAGAAAADSTDFQRRNTTAHMTIAEGCHPDYGRAADHTDGTPFPGKGWMHIEIRSRADSLGSDEQVRLYSPEGKETGFWRHADTDRDTFQVFAPVLAGQYTGITGSYDALTVYRYMPCMRN